MARLLCIGDSITDSSRLFSDSPLGNGYVRMLADKLALLPGEWEVINCGVDGFTVQRLLEQAHSRFLLLHPDIVTILIGINDIGLMMNTNRTGAQQQAMMDQFFAHYEELIQAFLPCGCRIVLMEPFIFPVPAEYRNWIPYVCAMSRGIAALAEKYSLPFLPLHQSLNQEGRRYGFDFITPDGIHLTAHGHQILAEKLLPLIYI